MQKQSQTGSRSSCTLCIFTTF